LPVIDITGERADYTDSGTGICVVFVPGLAGSRDWFAYQSAGLSDRYRTICYDLRDARDCRGRISLLRTGRPSYTLDLLADDVADLMSILHIPSAAVAGHSLGGMVALRFAVMHPERCQAVILSSTAPSYAGWSREDLISYYLPGVVRGEGRLKALWRWLVGAPQMPEDKSDSLNPLKQTAFRLQKATLIARTRLLSETDLGPALPEVAAPVLIVAGSEERPEILAAAQRMEESLPDSSLEIIEGADQFHFYTSHDQFNTIVADFLSHKAARP